MEEGRRFAAGGPDLAPDALVGRLYGNKVTISVTYNELG